MHGCFHGNLTPSLQAAYRSLSCFLLNCLHQICHFLHVEAMAIFLLFVANSLGGNFSTDK